MVYRKTTMAFDWDNPPKEAKSTDPRGPEHLSQLVATRRSALGLSQEELAAKMGTSRATIALIERGQIPPSPETLQRLTAALQPEAEKAAARDRARGPKDSRFAALGGLGRKGGVAAATVFALLLAALVVDEGGARLLLAAAIVAALWLSVIVAERAPRTRMRVAAVVALWIWVIGVGLISNADRSGVSDSDEIDAASAAAGADQAQADAAGAILGLIAAGNGQTTEAGFTSGAAGLPLGAHGGPCASLADAGARPMLLAVGILSSPWTGGLLILNPNQACGFESGLTLAGLGGSSASGVFFAARQGTSPGRQGSFPGNQGSSPGSQRSAPGGNNTTVGNTVKKPGGGGGNTAGNTVNNVGNTVSNTVKKPGGGAGNTVGNTVNNVGNTVNNVGNTVKKPAGGTGNPVGNTVGNTVNTVGNTVNTVGNTVKKPVNGVGNIVKGLGGL